ncbi:MAG: DUF3071 domain-containing protein [Streptosporangiales bacterium]|nr:DUF3071 domain-containing protein [Streptosporangiales bacterium]
MQELRLVAVSEDGRYLVLATAGRGTRFTLPIDERLRTAVRGQFSRLGQHEIEVENPLRPKEIQARIRAGDTAEDIAEAAGIPVERVRWFEGPVLQERQYMAQQAQRVPVRRANDSTPGPPLGEVVEERIRSLNVDPEDAAWDSRKREDGTWRVQVEFQLAAERQSAEWSFDPQRRHVTPLDDQAARLSSIDPIPAGDTVTPLTPRRAPAQEQAPAREQQPTTVRGAQQEEEPAQEEAPPAAAPQPEQRPARRAAGGRGRRASVPSWDEIMFGARRRD